MTVLAGDLGGTKIYLALFETKTSLHLVREQKFYSSKYLSFSDVIKAFLSGEKRKIDKACFGIAGPIKEQKCKTTNLPWEINAKDIEKEMKIPSVYLLNDLEAKAYGLQRLKPSEYFVLNEGQANQKANGALIAAGTGLGEAGLFWDGEKRIPFASEGGHCDFSPRNETETELLWYLQKKFGHVSWERIVSGPGIYHLYQFLIDIKKANRPFDLEKAFATFSPQEIITQKGVKKENKICETVIDWFISLYGAEAGNVALKFLSLSGLYIGGGIALNLIEKMKTGLFMNAFLDKGRFKNLLKTIPVKIILNDKTALLGAAHYAFMK